ncbi:MAG: FliI/YscN family ATPase [Alphaproteobacteria bacterium]|nr:FliI/YscN family ATPase [Alphaproteobacteria bacterium]
MTNTITDRIAAALDRAPAMLHWGAVQSVTDRIAEIAGLAEFGAVGATVALRDRADQDVLGEIVGFRGRLAVAMAYDSFVNIGPGCRASLRPAANRISPAMSWLGRTLGGDSRPLDDGPELVPGSEPYALARPAPAPERRGLLGATLDVGVSALNAFVSCCLGQRLGLFSGSGVGKTTLLGMLARHARADANVIILVGERGKELAEFLHKYLTEDLRSRTVTVVATSDQSAIMRRRAVLVATAIAEFLRDQGLNVLYLMDSVTRYAMALREIALAAGEPPGNGGYPAGVFSELPKFIERLGPLAGGSSITAFLTVLVEGDNLNEPVADAVRGFLDGHVLLDRRIADRGRYPPIDILRSVSRAMPECNTAEQTRIIAEALRLEAAYQDIEDLYKLSLYKVGTNGDIDRAIRFHSGLEAALAQAVNHAVSRDQAFAELAKRLEDSRS